MATPAVRIPPVVEVEKPPFWRIAWSAAKDYKSRDMTDNAASLTYFAMLSLFPAGLAAVSILALFGQASLATDAADYLVRNGADRTTADAVRNALQSLLKTGGGAASFTLFLSVALALNGASGAFAASGRALNKLYAVDEDRSFVRRKLTDLAATVAVLALFIVVLVAMFLGGGIAKDIFGTVGLGDSGATAWSFIRWPIAFGAALLAYGLIYAFAPSIEPRRWRWVTPGALTGVTVWIAASAIFAVYIKHFSSYGATYGTLGAAIVLLLWIYLSANAFLLGGAINVWTERLETAGRGGPPPLSPPPSPEDPTAIPAAPRPARRPGGDQTSGGPGARG